MPMVCSMNMAGNASPGLDGELVVRSARDVMKIRICIALYLVLLDTLPAQAATDEVDQLLSLDLEELMETKVMISTNTQQAISKAPSVVSVITADDIKATGATNLTEILQSVPGIYIKTNLFGARPLVTFRGAAGTHTLLMVNGVPVKDLVWNTGIFWRGLPTTMIDRVEIIRGPGSALFGSDASAGVINVITKAAAGVKQSEAGLRVGSFDTREAWVQHGGTWNDFDIDLTAQQSHTDGYNPRIERDGQTAKDEAYGTRLSHAPGNARYGYDNEELRLSMASGNWRVLTDYARHRNVAIGLTGAAVLDPQTRGSDSRFNAQLRYSNAEVAPGWGVNAELGYFHLDYTSGSGFQENPPGYTDATGTYPNGFINRMRAAERGVGVEVSALYSGLKDHSLRLGGGYTRDDLYSVEQFINKGTGPDGNPLPPGSEMVDVSDSPYAFAPEIVRRIGYLFAQDVWTFADHWDLTAGARYDRYSDFGSALNPRLALVWQTTERLTSKLMYGRAFRAPSYLELYSLTAATRPNPNLKPERSNTWDMSLSYLVSKDLKLGLDVYRFSQSNLITNDAANQFQNMGDSTSRGVELEAIWQAARTLRLSGNYSYRRDIACAHNAIPKKTAYLRADWAFLPNWNWNAQALWVDGIALPAGDSRAPLRAYTLVDTTLRYALRNHWEFAGSVRNLFDVDAREYSSRSLTDNLPLARRSFFAELRYQF